MYAAMLAGAASAVTLRVADTGDLLWTSPATTVTAAQATLATLDATPSRVLLVPRRELQPGTPVEANTIRLSGITVPVGVAVSPGAEVNVAGRGWTSSPTVAMRGEPVVVRSIAPPAGQSATVTLTTGTVETSWSLSAAAQAGHTHQTLYGPWGSCSASAPCDGTGTQSREILCLRSDGRFVAVTECGPTLTATQARGCPSPAGTSACVPPPALAIGAPTQYCAAGSSVRATCTGFTCPDPYAPENGACVSTRQGLPVLTVTAPETVREDAGSLRVTVTADYVPLTDLTLAIGVDASSVADGGDLAAGPWRLTLPAGQASASLDLSILDDAIAEADEPLVLNIGAPAAGATLAAGSAVVTTLLIDDDTDPVVSISAAAPEMSEDAGSVVLTLDLDRASARPVAVTLLLSHPEDAVLTAETVVFAPHARSASVTLTAIADQVDEPDETVAVTVAPVAHVVTGDPMLAPDTAEIVILDDDAAPILDLTGPALVAEGSDGVWSVTRRGESDRAIEVDWAIELDRALIADAATAEDVAGSLEGTLVFEPGGPETQEIGVSVLADQLAEPAEGFAIALTDARNATLGVARAEAILEDGDGPPVVAFGDSDSELTEGPDGITLPVTLSHPSVDEVALPFTVTGTTIAGERTLSASPLVIAPGHTGGAISVAATADAVLEGPETIVVTLETPINASLTENTADRSRSLTVLDNDETAPLLVLSAPSTVTEGDNGTQTLTFTVTKIGATALEARVNYAVTLTPQGAANIALGAGTSSTGTLVFAPTQTSSTLSFTITNDTAFHSATNETVRVVLSGPVNARLGTSSVTTTLVENEVGVIGSGTTISPYRLSTGSDPISCFDYRYPASTNTIAATSSGVYQIRPAGAPNSFQVFCDQVTDGGGYTLIAHNGADAGFPGAGSCGSGCSTTAQRNARNNTILAQREAYRTARGSLANAVAETSADYFNLTASQGVPHTRMLFTSSGGRWARYNIASSSLDAFLMSFNPNTEAYTNRFYSVAANSSGLTNECGSLSITFNASDTEGTTTTLSNSATEGWAQRYSSNRAYRFGPAWPARNNGPCMMDDAGAGWAERYLGGNNNPVETWTRWYVR